MKKLFLFVLFTHFAFAQLSVSISKVNIPNKMDPGTNIQVYVVAKNTGSEQLKRSNCSLEVSCKSCPDKEAGEAFEYQYDVPVILEPNKEYSFKWLIKTPTIPGDYKLNIAIKNGNSILTSKETNVTIEENFEAEINNTLKGIKLEPERKYPPYTITVKNTGKTTWPKGSYKVKVETDDAPDDAEDEDKEALEIEEDIELSNLEPGNSKWVSSGSFDSPSVGGDYKLKVTVLKDGKTFNAKNAETTIEASVYEKDPEVTFTEKVTRKMYPNKEYPVSFTVKNSGDVKWPEGKYTIKSTLTSKASSKVDDKVFEAEKSFSASEWEKGKSATVTFPKIKAPIEHGKYTVKYQILLDGKEFEADDSEITVYYEVVELKPELNVNRITLEKRMTPGKTYKLRVDVKNNGEIIAFKNDWVVKCKIRSKKPSNYKPPRGVFEFSLDGVEITEGAVKYVTGSIKVPKVEKETTLKLDFEVYYKGSRMGGPKQYDITIKP